MVAPKSEAVKYMDYRATLNIHTSVDAKHHGASLSERWNVTWVGNNSVCKLQLSRSASDKYTGIIEKTGSQNASAFQRLINGTLFSGEFSKSLTSEQEAVGAYFASGCIDQ